VEALRHHGGVACERVEAGAAVPGRGCDVGFAVKEERKRKKE
jgi:hypothetical protein